MNVFGAAHTLVNHVGDRLDEDHILPTMDDWRLIEEVAAVGMKSD